MDKEKSGIQVLGEDEANNITMTFTQGDFDILSEMFGVYGSNTKEVVYKAISLLYTIYKKDKDAEAVFLIKGDKRMAIPIK